MPVWGVEHTRCHKNHSFDGSKREFSDQFTEDVRCVLRPPNPEHSTTLTDAVSEFSGPDTQSFCNRVGLERSVVQRQVELGLEVCYTMVIYGLSGKWRQITIHSPILRLHLLQRCIAVTGEGVLARARALGAL